MIINGTIDSSGILLLDNYTIGNVGESGATDIVISIDEEIVKKFKNYHIEGTLPDGSSYTSKRLPISNDNIITYGVVSGITRYEGLVKMWVVAYNDKSTKWASNPTTVRVKDKPNNNIGGSSDVSGNDALYELYNQMMTKPTVIDSSASKVYVSHELLSKKVGDEILFDGQTYIYGESAFAYIGDAVRSPNKVVYIGSGVYTEMLHIIQEGIQLIGIGDVTLQGVITFMNANNARVSNITVESIFPLMDSEHECCQGSAIKVIGSSFDNFVVDNVRTQITGSGYGIDTASSGIKNMLIQDCTLSGGRYRNDATCDSIRAGVCMNTSILNNRLNGRVSFDDSIDDVLVSGNEITTVGGSAFSFSRRLCDNISIYNNMIYGDKISYAIQFNTVDSSDLREFGFVSNDVSYKNALVNAVNTVEINPDKFIFANNIIKRGNDSEYFIGDDVRLTLGDGNLISGAGGNNVVDSVAIAGVPFSQKGTTLSMSKSDLEYAMGFGDLAYTNRADLDLERVVRTDLHGKIAESVLPDSVATDEDVLKVSDKVGQNYAEYTEKVDTLENAIKANSTSIDAVESEVDEIRNSIADTNKSVTDLDASVSTRITEATKDLATTEYVDREIANLDLSTDEVAVQELINASLVGYATESKVGEMIDNAPAKTDENAVKGIVESYGYATKTELNAIDTMTESEAKAIVESYGYATESKVQEMIDNIPVGTDESAVKSIVESYGYTNEEKVQEMIDAIPQGTDEDAVKSIVESYGYATEVKVAEDIDSAKADVLNTINGKGFVTESEVATKVESYGYAVSTQVANDISAAKTEATNNAVAQVEAKKYATQANLDATNTKVTANESAIATIRSDVNDVADVANTNANSITALTGRVSSAEAKLVFNTTELTKVTVGNLLEGTDINGKTLLEVLTLILYGVKIEYNKVPVIPSTSAGNTDILGTPTDETITDSTAESKDLVGYFEESGIGEGYQFITPAAQESGEAQIVKIPAEATLVGIKTWDALTNSWQWLGGTQESSISGQYFVKGDDSVEVIDGVGNVTYSSYSWNVGIYGEDAADTNYRFYIK